MKITKLSAGVKNPERINVFVDGKFNFSLDISQVSDFGLRVGAEISKEDLEFYKKESDFGKFYTRAVEYCLMRPHSEKEVRDYLWKKTLPKKYKTKTGEIKEKQGYSKDFIERIVKKLRQKNYINDENFARFWVENRNLKKGISTKKLKNELFSKGVKSEIIENVLAENLRKDDEEIEKIIAKKARRYEDKQKLMQYLARQGFSFDDIKRALEKLEN